MAEFPLPHPAEPRSVSAPRRYPPGSRKQRRLASLSASVFRHLRALIYKTAYVGEDVNRSQPRVLSQIGHPPLQTRTCPTSPNLPLIFPARPPSKLDGTEIIVKRPPSSSPALKPVSTHEGQRKRNNAYAPPAKTALTSLGLYKQTSGGGAPDFRL